MNGALLPNTIFSIFGSDFANTSAICKLVKLPETKIKTLTSALAIAFISSGLVEIFLSLVSTIQSSLLIFVSHSTSDVSGGESSRGVS